MEGSWFEPRQFYFCLWPVWAPMKARFGPHLSRAPFYAAESINRTENQFLCLQVGEHFLKTIQASYFTAYQPFFFLKLVDIDQRTIPGAYCLIAHCANQQYRRL